MEFKGLQHCGLVVRDLEKSRWFYGTVIGLEEAPRPPNFTFRGAWFRGGGDDLHLMAADDTPAPAGFPDPGPAKNTGLATHIAFEVTDLAVIKARLDQHGIEILLGPLMRGDGFEQLYIHDPDGYMLEFFQWTGANQKDAPERAAIHS